MLLNWNDTVSINRLDEAFLDEINLVDLWLDTWTSDHASYPKMIELFNFLQRTHNEYLLIAFPEVAKERNIVAP